MRKEYLVMIKCQVTTGKVKIKLPKGCTGVMYVFKRKRDAVKFFGGNVETTEIRGG